MLHGDALGGAAVIAAVVEAVLKKIGYAQHAADGDDGHANEYRYHRGTVIIRIKLVFCHSDAASRLFLLHFVAVAP